MLSVSLTSLIHSSDNVFGLKLVSLLINGILLGEIIVEVVVGGGGRAGAGGTT